MTVKHPIPQSIPISRIFINLQNPRHEPVTHEKNAIEHLCEKENIQALARDIVKVGLNPLEIFGLVQIEGGKSNKERPTYYVAEGNRRFCAIKLLDDPDLAPANQRKAFEALSQKWTRLENVNAVVFSTDNEARTWMERIHSGEQGGIGRKGWNADQKQRFDGRAKNRLALALLDYAQQQEMITPTERQRKLTTAQRFIGNDAFRDALGLDQSDPGQLQRTRPKSDFDVLLKHFVRDLAEGKNVHSRMNKSEILEYASKLAALPGITPQRIPGEPLTTPEVSPNNLKKTPNPIRKKPRPPERSEKISFEPQINSLLKKLKNEKLDSLYHSICTINLENNTPIICIGVWAFFETLSACAGRSLGTSFEGFFSKSRITNYGIIGDKNAIRSALLRIQDYGNTTKHHPISATFNGEQLNNDMKTLKDLIISCINEALGTQED
ncbi:hypothetical protein [Tistrella mobilis]